MKPEQLKLKQSPEGLPILSISVEGECIAPKNFEKMRTLKKLEFNVQTLDGIKPKKFVKAVVKDRVCLVETRTGSLYDPDTGKCIISQLLWIVDKAVSPSEPHPHSPGLPDDPSSTPLYEESEDPILSFGQIYIEERQEV